MTERHIVTSAVIVKPVGEPIYSERCTEVRLDDEAGSLYLTIDQGKFVPGLGSIRVDTDEWPALRDAVEQMLAVAAELENQEFMQQGAKL